MLLELFRINFTRPTRPMFFTGKPIQNYKFTRFCIGFPVKNIGLVGPIKLILKSFKSINQPDLSHLQAPCTHSSPLYKDTGWQLGCDEKSKPYYSCHRCAQHGVGGTKSIMISFNFPIPAKLRTASE